MYIIIKGRVKLKIERINKIHELLKEKNNITIDRLCETFNVSKNTIRRDIDELERAGLIRKVYGGIILNDQLNALFEPFTSRETRNIQAKQKIANIATSLVKDGDVIYIDSGTTTMHMIPCLANKNHITIVTASIHVIDVATSYNNLSVIATGGIVYNPSKAFVGPNVISCIKNCNFSKVFLASTGISIEHGATNGSPFEYEIKQRVVQKKCPKFLLVDSTKLDKASLMTFCELREFDYIVMDEVPPEKYMNYFLKNNVKLLTKSTPNLDK